MSFGGPHAGYMACKETYMRQMPGRLVGRTVDADGKTAYTLTIQTREQHIKREKATSNICSNQSLIALSATLYLSLLGEEGFKQTGIISANLAHLLSGKLAKKGIKVYAFDIYNTLKPLDAKMLDVYDVELIQLENLKNFNGDLKVIYPIHFMSRPQDG